MTDTTTTLTARERELIDSVPTGLLIGGEWVDSSEGRTFDVRDPATNQVLATLQAASPEDGIRALDAAVAAQDAWAATAPRKRGEILRKAWELLQERRADFALLMTLEMGKPLAEADGEVTYGGEFLRWFSEEAVRITGRYGLNPEGTGTTVVSHRPVGPAFLITPWNFPLAMATRKIGPALAAGCTVVIKPAALTPLTTQFFAKLLIDAGVPAGVVNVISSDRSREISAPIIADPRLRKLSFTGSTPVGVQLLKQAADNVLRTSMELGGNAPFLVFEDADLDKAVEGALLAKFRNIGQACTAANRFIVHEDVAEEFGNRLRDRVAAFKVGRGTEEGVNIGPLIDDKAVKNSAALIEDAVAKGATVLTGGKAIEGDGTFFEPTVVTGLPKDARMLTEEIFAPLLGIVTFRDEEEAVRLANSTEYGLVGYAFTENVARGHRLIASVDTGMMGLNTGIVSNASAPFGGVKQSGMGREGGAEGIHEYLEVKYTLIPAS
ncbi:NAD-dependent succinate-semialdehyde dehydrogenase [Schumannella luteola]|uniref:Succinate-semialdehyde dehydrogenase/glutarate-semialdehyde dehydrogenase n=1 Tax=Schumannella luteola TaxID=472059 RepID=A0A852Y8H3_9MICO|nr:succinate-semialdehyde dehydrogenase/glutarate-semialdehyde dehydrogenase [Schumannella luteola]TPX05639.1 NAD-dependent succinate-semialdehyde dehydrogenase [Schumannella luteola]